MSRYPRISRQPPEWLVYNGLSRCPYLPEQTARLPMRMPMRRLTSAELARRLDAGDRRQGELLYRPACPRCKACESLRIEVEGFVPTRTQRRVWRRGESELVMEIGRPQLTPEKLALYNRHKVERNLMLGDALLDSVSYEQFLVETCADTIELSYRRDQRLVAVALVDRAANALSAVYTFFDPDFAQLSPGTYSILKEIELCRTWQLRYLYLGLYVADCAALSYKALYLPHERRIDGVWRRFDRSPSALGSVRS